jgi:hypothetical protein
MSQNPPKGDTNGGFFWDPISKALLMFADKFFLLGVLIITAMVASQVISSPDFIIRPADAPYLYFAINNTTGVSKDILNKDIYIKNATICAESIYSFSPKFKKRYLYPIYLSYSFINENGTRVEKVPGLDIKIDPAGRSIMTDGEINKINPNVKVIVTAGKIVPGEYTIEFKGRGSGGERLVMGEGAFQSMDIKSSGEEPIHHCTMDIVIEEKPLDLKLEQPKESIFKSMSEMFAIKANSSHPS